MPGAFPQDVNEGSKHVEHESSVQGTSQMPPPRAGAVAESVRQEGPCLFLSTRAVLAARSRWHHQPASSSLRC